MMYETKCGDCLHETRCRMLLDQSFDPEGPCDWTPSRYRHGSARVCPACGFKYGHNVECRYVVDATKQKFSLEDPTP
jgi:hypothetical protein